MGSSRQILIILTGPWEKLLPQGQKPVPKQGERSSFLRGLGAGAIRGVPVRLPSVRPIPASLDIVLGLR